MKEPIYRVNPAKLAELRRLMRSAQRQVQRQTKRDLADIIAEGHNR
jgi:hypothetical protein